jgi:penicillin-insensitive murein DD-endopeptidase
MRVHHLLLLSLVAACGPGGQKAPKATTQTVVVAPVSATTIRISTSDVKANKLFGAKAKASRQSPAAIGTYAKGCLAGGAVLPESGPTWQAMRLSRNRNWGHPEMITFLKELSAKAAQQPGWAGLYIGDISQPRGGPMLSGHQSHQMGLDADIWLYKPTRLNLSRGERESLSSTNVRAKSQRTVNSNWSQQHANILKVAAQDPRVDRIFITAPAKIWLCENTRGNRKWLQKIRPLYGHNTHFHVRMKCPKGLKGCVTQKPTVAQISNGGDGCDKTLQWWVTDYLNPPKVKPSKKPKPKKKKRGARQYTMADLPRQCDGVLASN